MIVALGPLVSLRTLRSSAYYGLLYLSFYASNSLSLNTGTRIT